MKNSAFGKQVDHVERLGDLARHGRVNEQVVDRLHDEWQADFERMNDEEREQLYREMSAATAAQGEREDDPEVIRAWEEYQNSLERMSLASQSSSLSRNWATREYVFHDNNPFLESSNPYQEGVALYGAGKLNEAILAFEAALKANMKDSNCWRLLGTCYAENDDDVAALVPLRKSVEADETNLEALLELGVSFTNELEEKQALHYLHSWLMHHPDFSSVPGDNPVDAAHVRDMFLRASKYAPNDVDVWTVLGVLYNLSREYDAAINAFEKACQLDPTNYSLFNKLGATYANSDHPDGSKLAIKSYRRALELKPNYVRSWANMGISYANQNSYHNAAKFYLKAISLNEGAEHLWGYLRFTLSCMGRPDLIAKCDTKNLALFKDEFKFSLD